MRVESVGRALYPAEIYLQPRGLRGLGDPGIDLHCVFLAAELGLQVRAPVGTLLRHVGVQLKRVPLDGQRMLGPRFERAVEIGLADIAPGTDGIGENVERDHDPVSLSALSARRKSFPFGFRGSEAWWT